MRLTAHHDASTGGWVWYFVVRMNSCSLKSLAKQTSRKWVRTNLTWCSWNVTMSVCLQSAKVAEATKFGYWRERFTDALTCCIEHAKNLMSNKTICTTDAAITSTPAFLTL